MHSSLSLSETSTVVQVISSRVGKGWYVTFISSFATPGMSNLAVTCRAEKRVQNAVSMSTSIAATLTLVPSGESLNSTLRGRRSHHLFAQHMWTPRTHIDRCLLKGGAGEGTRAAGCADGLKGTPLRGECRIGGDLPLSSDLIFEGEAAISRSLALRTAPHTWSRGSESPGVMGPDELVEAWEPKGVEKGSGAIGRFRGGC